jgi:hypothetical protein
LSLLFFLESRDQNAAADQGAKRVEGLQTERHQALQKELSAIAQEDAAAHDHDFWSDLGSILSDVAKVAGVVASLAAVVCTAGAATPIAALAIGGAILSTASLADGEFHVLAKLGLDSNTAGWIDVGLSLGGGVASGGAGLLNAASTTASATSAIDQTARTCNAVATVATGAADAGQGVATIEQGQAQAQADRDMADQIAATAQSAHAMRLLEALIRDVKAAQDGSERVLSTIRATKGIANETTITAAIAVRG